MASSGPGFNKLAKLGGEASGDLGFLTAWAAHSRTLVIMANNLFGLDSSRAGSLAEAGKLSAKATSARSAAEVPGGNASDVLDFLAAWAAHSRTWVIRADRLFG